MFSLVPRFEMGFRPSRSFFDRWMFPEAYFNERMDWGPATDIAETDKEYVVTMEVPGLDMKKTDISYREGVLTVKGEKHKESQEGECCHCSERYSGSFNRSFNISGHVDRDKIDATYKDGILRLSLPKSAESVRKRIEIH